MEKLPSAALRLLRLLRLFAANPESVVRLPAAALSPQSSAVQRKPPACGISRWTSIDLQGDLMGNNHALRQFGEQRKASNLAQQNER